MSTPPPRPPKNLLLLGAGELGTALLTHIHKLPDLQITVAIRKPASYTHILTTYPGVTLLPLDLTAPSSTLVPVFAEYDVVISATGFAASPDSVVKLGREVLAAGRRRQQRQNEADDDGDKRLWFLPWQWGVDYDTTGDARGLMPLFGAQRDVRELLRAEAEGCGVRWSVVSTGIFMSFLFAPFWGIVQKPGDEGGAVTVRCLRDWQHSVTVTDVGDIGRVVARILDSPASFTANVLFVAGDTVSYAQLADIMACVTGKTVVRETWGLAYLEEELRKEPGHQIKRYRVVFAGDGVAWEKKGTVNEVLGMEMLGVEEFARGWLDGGQ